MFEYQILRADGFVPVDQLNILGNDGWELVAVVPDESGYDYIFKKFLRPSPAFMQSMMLRNPPPTHTAVMEAFKNADST